MDCVRVIDDILEKEEDAESYCRNLFYTLKSENETLDFDASEEELDCFTTCEMYLVMYALAPIENAFVKRAAGWLSQTLAMDLRPMTQELAENIMREMNRMDDSDFEQEIQNMVDRPDFLSDEIDALLKNFQDSHTVNSSSDVAPKSRVHLATNYKTALAVLVEAMYKEGWLVDENGEKLTNRDDCIKDIAQWGFNEEIKHVQQLLSTPKNRNAQLNQKFENLLKAAKKKYE